MNKSESIKNLAIALSKFQGEVKNPANTATNPFFKSKYAPLETVLNTVRPILSKHGLSVVQAPSTDGGNITISTTLIHESGEYMEFPELSLKMDKVTAQGAGSAITYARRYAISAILGISSEDDDDGNHAEENSKTKVTEHSKSKTANTIANRPAKTSAHQDIVDNSLASDAQIGYIDKLLKNKGFEMDAMIKYLKREFEKDDLKALTKQEASTTINMLNNIGK